MKARLSQQPENRLYVWLPQEQREELLDKLERVCRRCYLSLYEIRQEMLYSPITVWMEKGPDPSAQKGAPLPEPMLLFCGVSSSLLGKALQVMQQEQIPRIPHKAVLTEHNRQWTPRQLYGELSREDQAVRGKG